MNDFSGNTLDPKIWGDSVQPALCPHCDSAHLYPFTESKMLCPACHESKIQYQPNVIRPEPPELLIDFIIKPEHISNLIRRWVNGVWLHPKELSVDVLMERVTRSFIPMWLVDSKVSGSWEAQMGFDYQVASSQEKYQGGTWKTNRLTETRIRWEPRAGTIERNYYNIQIPALDGYSQIINNLGKFQLEHAVSYTPEKLGNAFIRIPNLLPEAALPQTKSRFNYLAAADCQDASGAQHIDEFSIEAEYGDLNWTQLLLPIYTTAYTDENGDVHTIQIHGQTGKIFGKKRANQKLAQYLSLGLAGVAFVCFVIGLLFALGIGILPLLGVISFIFFTMALFIGVTAPLPTVWAWNFNRSQDKK